MGRPAARTVRDRDRTMLIFEDPVAKHSTGKSANQSPGPQFLQLAISTARGSDQAPLPGGRPQGSEADPHSGGWDKPTSASDWIWPRFPTTARALSTRSTRGHRGDVAYMAPEQTGRMNRSIDSRSDLYALGVVFYQMLTGVLPFTTSDAMELIHCHIARTSAPPSERVANIPGPISDIVIKLLAKTAESATRPRLASPA